MGRTTRQGRRRPTRCSPQTPKAAAFPQPLSPEREGGVDYGGAAALCVPESAAAAEAHWAGAPRSVRNRFPVPRPSTSPRKRRLTRTAFRPRRCSSVSAWRARYGGEGGSLGSCGRIAHGVGGGDCKVDGGGHAHDTVLCTVFHGAVSLEPHSSPATWGLLSVSSSADAEAGTVCDLRSYRAVKMKP
ncbi:hypothetical protein GW7_10836 [Heterocephalus glaber]|uniref:Uncharacterized protein n=1 Tax=Heterocephalus glaber TaxID=10181 RepID=G5BL55_HETGA|nr:hypothetical protein GW7_10836 [Heterocephalus glaber]